MRPILTDRVAWSVGLSVTLVSPAKTAAPIELPFGLRTWVGPGNHVLVLNGVQIPPWEGAKNKKAARVEVNTSLAFLHWVRITFHR